MTLAEYILDVPRRDLAVPGQRQWLERVGTREPVGTAGALGCPLATGDLRLTRAPGLRVPLVVV